MNRKLTLLAGLAATSIAFADPGDVLWTIHRDGYGMTARPHVASDGALYWTFRGLTRLDPATGAQIWFRENHASQLIAIAPDGTIYGTGSVNHGTPTEPFWHPTAYAITPDNQQLWEWEYLEHYWYPDAGPTLGPDGNIYIISYGGYRSPGHLFSLTPSGSFRWEYLRFADGSGVQDLTFNNGAVMKVGEYTGIPGGPLISYGSGLMAADMQSGQLAWSIPYSGVMGDPVVSPLNGDYYLGINLAEQLRAYTPPTSLDWVYSPQWSPTGLNTRQIGPDGNLYVSEGISRVHSLDPSGNIRWSNPTALPASYYYIPSVTPDGSLIIYTTTGPGETPGYVTALRTSDGSKAWEITLPGPANGYNHVRSHGGVTFSPDSRVAYIPATSICYCGTSGYMERAHLFAIHTGIGGAGDCYANCDASNVEPVLNVADFTCFLQRFAAGESYANCDQSTAVPVLNVADFTCFLQRFAAGCR
jgi:hypothetical protein